MNALPKLVEALTELQSWVENNVAYGMPEKLSKKIDNALKAAAKSPS